MDEIYCYGYSRFDDYLDDFYASIFHCGTHAQLLDRVLWYSAVFDLLASILGNGCGITMFMSHERFCMEIVCDPFCPRTFLIPNLSSTLAPSGCISPKRTTTFKRFRSIISRITGLGSYFPLFSTAINHCN